MRKKVTNREIYEIASKYFMIPSSKGTPKDKNNFNKGLDDLFFNQQDVLRNLDLFRNLYGFPRNQFMAMKYILQTSRLVAKDRVVAATIASFYSSKLGYSYPSQQQIAEICGMKIRTLADSIEQMKLSGEWLITPVQSAPYEKTVSNRYYLLPPAGYGILVSRLQRHEESDEAKISSLSYYKRYGLDTTIAENFHKVFKSLDLGPSFNKNPPNLDDTTEIEVIANTYKSIPRYLEPGIQKDNESRFEKGDFNYRKFIREFTKVK